MIVTNLAATAIQRTVVTTLLRTLIALIDHHRSCESVPSKGTARLLMLAELVVDPYRRIAPSADSCPLFVAFHQGDGVEGYRCYGPVPP